MLRQFVSNLIFLDTVLSGYQILMPQDSNWFLTTEPPVEKWG